ncbi:MAG: NAD(P)-dependent oxidoreductase [Clostridiales bacterium]|nr:NAD(P)-dependent oxidoreductase [Clostridiales bacterium]
MPFVSVVTGASGFIGRHLVAALLENGSEVYAVVRNAARAKTLLPKSERLYVLESTVGSDGAVSCGIPHGSDVMYHLAWSDSKPESRVDFGRRAKNIQMTLSYLRLAKESGVKKIVMAGSTKEYLYCGTPINKEARPTPGDAYGAVKVALRYLAGQFARQNGIAFNYAVLETQINLTNYSQAQSRIFGFMGEIIFSAYIYRLEKSGKYRVRHVPLLFFNYTEKITDIMPVKKPNVVPVLFLHQHKKDFLFATALQSFLSHAESSCFYELLLLSEPVSSEIKIIFAKMLSGFPNVSLRYLNAEMLRNQINERYGTSEILPFLPHVLMHFSKMLVFGSNTLFEKSVLPLFQAELSENKIIAAPYFRST